MKHWIMPMMAGALVALGAGCMDRTVLVDQATDTEIVAGLGYKDFEEAATEATHAILTSSKVRNATQADRTYIVAIGRVTDETPLGIDTDLLTARIAESLLENDRFTIAAGSEVMGGVPAKAEGRAPNFSLTGKIIARDVRRDNGGHQYEYAFQLRMNDLATGTVLMMKETRIVKRTGEKEHTW